MLSRGVEVHGDIASQSGSVFVGNPSFSANSINFNDRRDSDKYQCLRELYFTDSNVEKARLETREDILIETSYNWIFQDDSFQTWLSDEKSQILRITGEPGKGKTMAMIGIINSLVQQIPPKPSAIAFYFCRATDDKLSTTSGVIKGLLHHLLSQKSNEVLIRHLQAKFDKAGSGIFEGSTVGFALQDVLLDILQDAAFEAFYFIVDALDECTRGLTELLKFIRTTSSKSRKLKWLVSSRDNIDVDRFFRCLDNATTINLEQHALEIGLGIQEYIKNRVDILGRRHEYSADQTKQITAALSAKAEGTFLWIHLACQSLDRTRRAKAVRSLEIMPSGLNSMYERMAQILQEINHDDEDRLLCQAILSTVTVAVRPLRMPELLSIVNMASPDTEDIAMELTKLIARCGSFLSVQNGTIYFIHQSAREYLEKNAAGQGIILSGSLELHHQHMARNCFLLFKKRLRQDVCGLKRLGYPSSELTKEHILRISDIEYACCNWALHIHSDHCDGNLPQWLDAAIDSFFDNDFLHWVEALAILNVISAGITQLSHFASIYKASSSISRVTKAKRFLLEHRMTLEAAPLQLYSAAVIFSSQGSWIKSQYESYFPQWIEIPPQLHAGWDGLLRVLTTRGEFISAMAISSDDKLIATGFSSLALQLWDVETGHLLLEDSWINRIHASGTPDSTENSLRVRICDMKFTQNNNKILTTLESRADSMVAISLLDIRTRTWAVIFPFQSTPGSDLAGGYERLVLSPDGLKCAGYSRGSIILFSTVNIMDLATAAPSDDEIAENITICDRQFGQVKDLRFSLDSRSFIVLSKNEMRKYHALTGSRISQIIKPGQESRFLAAKISTDCRTVVDLSDYWGRTVVDFSDWGRDIMVWKATTNDNFQLTTFPVEGTGSLVREMVLSESGRWLVLSNSAGTKLIDISDLQPQSQPTGRSAPRTFKVSPFMMEGFYEYSDGNLLCRTSGADASWITWKLDSHMMHEIPLSIHMHANMPQRSMEGYCLMTSASKRLLCIADRLGDRIGLWSIDEINESGHPIYPVSSLSYSPAEDHKRRQLRAMDREPSRSRLTEDYFKWPRWLAITNDGLRLASISGFRRKRSQVVGIWDTITHTISAQVILRCPLKILGVVSAAFFNCGRKIAVYHICGSVSESQTPDGDIDTLGSYLTHIQIWNTDIDTYLDAEAEAWWPDSLNPLLIVSADDTTVIIFTSRSVGHWVLSTGECKVTRFDIAPLATIMGLRNVYAQLAGDGLALLASPDLVVFYDFRAGVVVGEAMDCSVEQVRVAAVQTALKPPVEDCVVALRDGRVAICDRAEGRLVVTHHENLDEPVDIGPKQHQIYFWDGWFRLGRHPFLYTPMPYKPTNLFISSIGIIFVECANGQIYNLVVDVQKLAETLGIST